MPVRAAATLPPRERILDAARELFYRRGINSVGVDLIAKTARVSKKTMYEQFASKDDLVAEYLRAGRELEAREFVADGSDPIAEIIGAFTALQRSLPAGDYRGCPFLNANAELADAHHPGRVQVGGEKEDQRRRFERLLRRAGVPSPRRLSRQLVVLWDGAVMQSSVQRSTAPVSDALGVVRSLLAPAARE